MVVTPSRTSASHTARAPMRGATALAAVAAVAGAFAWSSGSRRAVIGASVGVPFKKREIPPGLSAGGTRVRCVRFASRLSAGASSIPPSKENDEPKNREYEEHAEETGGRRSQARAGGAQAALHGHGGNANSGVKRGWCALQRRYRYTIDWRQPSASASMD